MSARRAEIEAKRAKLAELRRAREERARRLQGAAAAVEQDAAAERGVDDLVASLLNATPPAAERTDSPAGHAAPPPAPQDSKKAAHVAQAEMPAPPAAPPAAARAPSPPRVFYSKEVQTDPIDAPRTPSPPPPTEQTPAPASAAPSTPPRAPPRADTHAAPEREREAPEFLGFVHAKASVMERMLAERYDVLRDYTADHTPAPQDSGGLRLAATLWDDTFAHRAVADLDFSTCHPELVAAAYTRRSVALRDDDHDGVVGVWNLHAPRHPDFVLTASADLVAVLASPFHPTLYVGGTTGGQVVLWDARTSPRPVQRTPLALARAADALPTHAAPISSLRFSGSAQAPQLTSASLDGVVCTWALDTLARPEAALTLTNPRHPRHADVGVTALDVPPSDAARFLVGTQEGNVWGAQRVDRGGRPAGLDTSHVYVGHTAPVTQLACHPPPPALDVVSDGRDVFLTTSLDGTTNVWRTPSHTAPPPPASDEYPHANARVAQRTPLTRGSSQHPWRSVAPLLRFEHARSYVMDARWHPHHPGVWAQVDADGQLDIVHLTHSIDRPWLAGTTPGRRALHRVAWERRRPATRLAAGGVDGRVHLYEVTEPALTQGETSWAQVLRTLDAL